jgi:3-hydroxy acid dehydrogenase/malonic semialdehyde reductase
VSLPRALGLHVCGLNKCPVLIARRADKLEELKAEILKANSKSLVHLIPMDVLDRKAVASILDNIPTDFKDIDILVNVGPSAS